MEKQEVREEVIPKAEATLKYARISSRNVKIVADLIRGKNVDEALAIEKAGAFAVVLECVPAKLAAIISEKLSIPRIGIGAGVNCDGQILVYQDMLGVFSDFTPKFVKKYENLGEKMNIAFRKYIEEIKDGVFPAEEHSFKISDEAIEKLY